MLINFFILNIICEPIRIVHLSSIPLYQYIFKYDMYRNIHLNYSSNYQTNKSLCLSDMGSSTSYYKVKLLECKRIRVQVPVKKY
jgi:hypothetical protein